MLVLVYYILACVARPTLYACYTMCTLMYNSVMYTVVSHLYTGVNLHCWMYRQEWIASVMEDTAWRWHCSWSWKWKVCTTKTRTGILLKRINADLHCHVLIPSVHQGYVLCEDNCETKSSLMECNNWDVLCSGQAGLDMHLTWAWYLWKLSHDNKQSVLLHVERSGEEIGLRMDSDDQSFYSFRGINWLIMTLMRT